MDPTVPVLAVSIMNRPDLLDRMLDSIDVAVERPLIIDNGRTGYQREGWVTCTPPFQSMGWAGSFNFAIGQTPGAPWWLYVNNDAWFEPGKLALLCERMDAMNTSYPAVAHDEWTIVALHRAVVGRVGLLDEWSFFPIYFEDTDYARRCHLAGIGIEQGDWCLEGDLDGSQMHSMTTRSDPALDAANNRTIVLNRQAYIAKWGGPPGEETFVTPWGRDVPLWATKPDPWGRLARSW